MEFWATAPPPFGGTWSPPSPAIENDCSAVLIGSYLPQSGGGGAPFRTQLLHEPPIGARNSIYVRACTYSAKKVAKDGAEPEATTGRKPRKSPRISVSPSCCGPPPRD
jgi:hypothetical protein|eukprot:SAG25_NODE_550_length_6992_cov_63.479182_1_plen_108_part_00